MRPNPQYPADLVTSTEEILNGKLSFLYSVIFSFSSSALGQGSKGFEEIVDWCFTVAEFS